MNKLPYLILFISLSLDVFSQQAPGVSPAGSKEPDHFVLKGRAKNHPQDFFELSISGFMGMERISVPIDKKGTFSKTVALTQPQDLFLDLGEGGIPVFAAPGDTLELAWDATNFDRTFRLIAQQPIRTVELDLLRELDHKFRQEYIRVYQAMENPALSDSVKLEGVKKLFAAQVQTVLAWPATINSKKIFCDIYFRHVSMLRERLLLKSNLSFSNVPPEGVTDSMRMRGAAKAAASGFKFSPEGQAATVQRLKWIDIQHDRIDEEMFNLCGAYRDFLSRRIRTHWAFPGGYRGNIPKEAPNFLLHACYRGVTQLVMLPAVKDWYLAKTLMEGFGNYSFAEAEEAYHKFFPEIRTPVFRDTLERYYNAVQRLRPGKQAPGFSLKDRNGKTVSLGSLKGKVVYIDFWGVYCGPCRYDIMNHAAKLHERYKDKNVAFVNICVDVAPKEWKESLDKLHLDGINLLAEGWTAHPVAAAYNVTGVPHYVLIDRNGSIADNNAPGMGDLLAIPENGIDKLLAP